ncbi:MAG: RICIN domain-containing protein [Spirosoma sp.]|nr:RICIN domain-containing protein [Spirosoma sp.]
MKLIKLIPAVLCVLVSISASYAQFDPNYKGYYNLKTQFRGDAEMLEGNGAASTYMNGASFMSPQKGATGQRWKVIPEPGKDGYYRLKTQDRGDNECLEGNEMKGKSKNGVAFVTPCRNVTGQLWKIDKDGANYRLTTMFQGKEHNLEGNQMKGAMGGNAFLNTRQNVSGQLWKFDQVR